MGVRDWFRRTPTTEAAPVALAKSPERSGFEYGIGPSGVNEYSANTGTAAGTDRRTLLTQLYEVYLTCPWSWAAVNAISRTISAGGLVTDWTGDTDGEDEVPEKPGPVLALEALLAWCNPREDIRQLIRSVIADLEVFGDAFIEVVWFAGQPVGLYSLDCPSTTPIADQHGTITGYVQITDLGQRAEFDPHEVIHISLDAPRSGVFGVSPTQAALLPITAWLFTAATLKERMRRGNPPNIHVDMPASMSPAEMNRWNAQYMVQNLGPRNIGKPITTKGGAQLQELKHTETTEYLQTLDQKRDEILATYGTPPAKVGVIESGNLGGGTGESQDKTFRVNTCDPVAALVLEKINYHIVQLGFGITEWQLKFGDVDWRDSKTVEEIRDMRIRNGLYTINRARAEINEPAIDGGDSPTFIERSWVVEWRDMRAMSMATVAAKLKGTVLEPGEPDSEEPVTVEKPEPEPVPDALAPFAGQDNPPDPEADPDADVDPDAGETWQSRYRARLKEALRRLPPATEADRAG